MNTFQVFKVLGKWTLISRIQDLLDFHGIVGGSSGLEYILLISNNQGLPPIGNISYALFESAIRLAIQPKSEGG